jgi:hypothetical protein
MKNTTLALLKDMAQGHANFAAVLAHIDAHYHFTPTAFDNGSVHNPAGQNNGSCKVLAFAQAEGLDAAQTLGLFAEHYAAVLAAPQAQDHANIRSFMQHGFAGLRFAGQPLR